MSLFEGYERRIDKINEVCKQYGLASIEDAKKVCDEKGINPYQIVEDLQPIAFENAKWAYTLGAAIAIKKGCTKAADAAKAIGEGLQAFCVPGTVADHRKVGLGHGNLGAMLLSEDAGCFAFLAGHESFAAAEGAIGIAKTANKVRKNPLRVILNGLGKDAAQIISRINGFTYVVTDYDFKTGKLNIVEEIKYGTDPERAKVKSTALTPSRKALPSWSTKMSISPSRVTPRTRRASSIRSLAATRRLASRRARSTSRSLRAAARAVRSIRITWQPARLPMV